MGNAINLGAATTHNRKTKLSPIQFGGEKNTRARFIIPLYVWYDGPTSGAPLWGHNGRRGTPPNLTI